MGTWVISFDVCLAVEMAVVWDFKNIVLGKKTKITRIQHLKH